MNLSGMLPIKPQSQGSLQLAPSPVTHLSSCPILYTTASLGLPGRVWSRQVHSASWPACLQLDRIIRGTKFYPLHLKKSPFPNRQGAV